MKTKKQKNLIFGIAALGLSIIIFVVSAEVILRLLGYTAWQDYSFDKNEPVAYQFDSELGWKHLPGSFIFPKKAAEGKDFTMTFLKDGQRITGTHNKETVANILFIGGSFTQGWAISDQDTFSWKIQKKMPQLNVKNYGVGGYSSYQSLLMLKRILPGLTPPTVVFYGIIGHHENRNIASKAWLEALTKHSKRNHVSLPYCTLSPDAHLAYHKPEAYTKFPLIKWSATMTALNQLYMFFKTAERTADQRKVTEKIIIEMDNLCKKNNSRFVVLLFFDSLDIATHYAKFLIRNKISYLNCCYTPNAVNSVPGDGHPNGALNSIWAEKIGKTLEKSLNMKDSTVPAVNK